MPTPHVEEGRVIGRHRSPARALGDLWPRAAKTAKTDNGFGGRPSKNQALPRGPRGRPGGLSLPPLLGAGQPRSRPDCLPLILAQVHVWFEACYRSKGCGPTRTSGPVAEWPGLTWGGVAYALALDRWGLPGGATLAREVCKVQNVLLRTGSGNR
jgi:hypothetical protein